MKQIPLIIGLIAALLVLAACTPQIPPGPDPNPISVQLETGDYFTQNSFDPDVSLESKTFASEAELETFLATHQNSGNYYGGSWGGGEMMMVDMVMDSAAPRALNAVAESSDGMQKTSGASNDFSETNNQVAGVDEGDIIKTDGQYIYTTSGQTLFIIDAHPGEDAEVISTISLEKGIAEGLFINGDTLMVFGSVNNNNVWKEIDYTPSSGATYLEVYDVSDREEPDKTKDFLYEGRYSQSRMIGDDAYIVTQTHPWRMPRPIPIFFEDGVRSEVALDSIRYFPMPYDNVMYATINAIDIDNLKTESLTLTIESSSQLYMSEDNMYLAYTKNINEWEIQRKVAVELLEPKLDDKNKALVEKIKLVDNDVMSNQEKENKIFSIITEYVGFLPTSEQDDLADELEAAVKDELESYEHYEYTVINKVSVHGLNIEAVANGKVPGHINNQFSMDEDNDVLRIATTVNQRWSSYGGERRDSENMVFTLDEDLDELDRIEGIAKTEQIYSTRFIDDRLYMVTFRRTDPFFVVDLSNPKDIELLGELKIPGFSRYLHPYDENTLIGLGRDATDTGRQEGLKISLFDVSDVKNPKEITNWVGDEKYAQSTAEHEHKAFLFSREKNMLVIPAYSSNWRNDGTGYNGAFVFEISEDEIELRGLIDHSKGAQHNYGSAVERSLYIENELYTKSYGLLRINAIDDLHAVQDVDLDQVKINGKIPVY